MSQFVNAAAVIDGRTSSAELFSNFGGTELDQLITEP
jgi:hypothetical protein